MKLVFLLLATTLLSGCNSYGIPKNEDLHETVTNFLPQPNCVGIQVNMPIPENAWELENLKRTKANLLADLNNIQGIRVLDSNSPVTLKRYVLELSQTPFILNEPYLMVATLGLIPQPFSHFVGYRFEILTSDQKSIGKVDTTHMVNNWTGWFVSLIALAPSQTLNEEKANEKNQKQVINDIKIQFDKLGMFDGCIASKVDR